MCMDRGSATTAAALARLSSPEANGSGTCMRGTAVRCPPKDGQPGTVLAHDAVTNESAHPARRQTRRLTTLANRLLADTYGSPAASGRTARHSARVARHG